jgi:hypothetical protein
MLLKKILIFSNGVLRLLRRFYLKESLICWVTTRATINESQSLLNQLVIHTVKTSLAVYYGHPPKKRPLLTGGHCLEVILVIIAHANEA